MRQMVTRRGFIGAGVALAAAGCASSAAQGAAERDERFSVFLSDTHIPGEGTELDKNHVEHDPAYMYKRLAATVDEVLAMRPMPARKIRILRLFLFSGRLISASACGRVAAILQLQIR